MGYIAYALAWVSTSIAVSTGIYYTHKASCLWFMLIPALISFHAEPSDNEKTKEGK